MIEELVLKVFSSSETNEANFTDQLAAELSLCSNEDLPRLSLSEAHVIDAIGKDPNITATAIAEKLGITRGGISKIVARLEKKGYLKASAKDDNRKERKLSLTPQGDLAFKAHAKLHQRKLEKLIQLLDKYTDEELEVLIRIFTDFAASDHF